MTKKEKINILNKLLKAVFDFGWRIGASWDSKKFDELFDINGYLKEDIKIEDDLRVKINELLKALNLDPNKLIIYTKEDLSIHENDWTYIAPLIEEKNKK